MTHSARLPDTIATAPTCDTASGEMWREKRSLGRRPKGIPHKLSHAFLVVPTEPDPFLDPPVEEDRAHPEQFSAALDVSVGLILEGRDAAGGPALGRGVVADERQGVLHAGDLVFERRVGSVLHFRGHWHLPIESILQLAESLADSCRRRVAEGP